MSKAEKRAKERYWLELNNIETQEKYAAYVEGYHQAEKDLELTADDIRLIDDLIFETNDYQKTIELFKESKEKLGLI